MAPVLYSIVTCRILLANIAFIGRRLPCALSKKKETCHFFSVTLTKIRCIKINHIGI